MDVSGQPGQRARGGALMRLRGLVRKEFLQILRDPSSIAIAFLMPVILLLIFGYGVSLDAEHVPVAIVMESPDADSLSLAAAFRNSRYFSPVILRDMREAKDALTLRRVDAIIRLQQDFARRLGSGRRAPIQVILNGVDSNNARLISGYVEGVWGVWMQQRAAGLSEPLGIPVGLEHRVWFNSEVRSRNFLVPGLVALIMTLIGALLTAMVMAREWERGTLEALLVTPVRIREVLLGKLIAYFTLGAGGVTISVMMAVWLFGVPLRGSIGALALASTLFLLTALGMGLLISSLAKNQFVAGQIAIIVTFLPAFLLSGFIFDVRSMPWPIQALTHAIAARYLVSILQTVFLAGDVWDIVGPNAAALAVMAGVFLALTRLKTRKRLE